MFVKIIIGNAEFGKTERTLDVRSIQFNDMLDWFNETEDKIREFNETARITPEAVEGVKPPVHINPAGHIEVEFHTGAHECLPLDPMLVGAGYRVYIMNDQGKTVDSYKYSMNPKNGHISVFRN
jgi:hypothetical protein